MKKCNNCQALINDSANFCHLCGGSDFSPVETAPVPAQPAAQAPVPQEPMQEEPFFPEPAGQDSSEPEPSGRPAVASGAWADTICAAPQEPKPKKKPGKGLIIGICAGIVAIIAAVVVISILTNPVRRFMKSVEKEDVETAFEIYLEDIAGNDKRSEKLTETIDAYADEQLALYVNQEITYDELSSRLYAIDQSCVYNQRVYEVMEEAWNLNYYRETYASAEKALAEGNYAAAVTLYSEVAGMDFENGEDAVSKLAQATEAYRSSVLEDVQAMVDEHSYSSAMALIEEALCVLPGDAKLQAAMEDCTQSQYDYTIDCLIEEALVYTGNSDYIGAIAYLDEQIGAYPDEVRLQQAKDDCLKSFEEYVIQESFRLASEGNFTQALSLTTSGLSYFSSTTVTELQQIYISHIPVALGQMEIFKNSSKGGSNASNTNKTDKYLEDKFGGTYSHSLSVGFGSLTYLLNFKYQTFSGTVGFPKSLESDDARQSATLTISGDGQEIAVFRNITDTTKPEEFNLDISGYEQITLTWECEGSNVWEDWGDFATIFDGILTPIPLDMPDSVS